MKFYQAFDVDEETPVDYLAVHPLRWKTAEWGEPTIMFREVDDEIQALADAAPDLLAACKAQAKFDLHCVHCDRCGRAPKYCEDGWQLWKIAGNLRNQAIAKAKGDQC